MSLRSGKLPFLDSQDEFLDHRAGGAIPPAYSPAQFSRGALKPAHHIGVYMTLQARILQQELL